MGFVLDLTGGIRGYTTTAAVVAALATDGHGGTQLTLGSGATAQVIDFSGTAKTYLTAAHFKIG